MPGLSEKALKGYASYTKREISYARYKVENTYYSVGVDRFEFPEKEPGTLRVWLVFAQPTTGSFVVSEVQLIDTSEEVFLSHPEAIQVDAAQEGCLYEVTFKFKEGE